MSIKAYEYQKEGVYDIEDFNGRALLADEMGLGKTLSALWFMRRERIPTFPALVICPAPIKYTWEHEALEHFNLRPQVLEGQTPTKGPLGTIPKLTIINPDILRFWLPRFKLYGLKTVVLDECQMFMNRTSKRTKAAMILTREVPNVLALSGTPLTNRPAELWPTLHMIRPDVFPQWFSFAHEYCAPFRTPWGWEYKGATNLPKLHALLRRTCMIRRLKKDVLDDLPEKMRRVVHLDIPKRSEYNEASNNFLVWLMKKYGAVRAERASRAAKIARIGYLLRLVARLKARQVVDWATTFLTDCPNEKLILFGVHRKMIDVLHRRIPFKNVVVDGSVHGRRRKYAVDQFQNDADTRLFIGNIKAAGLGLTLTAASNLAFTEMWWRPGDHLQAEDRIHRIGQHSVSWISYLIAGGTIEEDLCRIIQNKQAVITAVLDGGGVMPDINVYDQLIKVLEDRAKA